MPIIILSLLIASILSFTLMPQKAAILSYNIHTSCTQLLNNSHLAKSIHQALFCGASLNDPLWRPVISSLGLLHLLVISGLHLGLIEKTVKLCCSKFPHLGFYITLSLLSALCFITSFQAPCLRAFFYFISKVVNKKFYLNWSGPYCHFLSGSLCLFLFPHFFKSHSLIISWLVTLIVSQFYKNKLLLATIVYLTLIPWQFSFFLNSPLSVLVNAFFTAPLIPLLFLFSLFDMLFLSLNFNFEWHWQTLYEFLRAMQIWFPKIEPRVRNISLNYLWSYLFTIQVICLWTYRRNSLLKLKANLNLQKNKLDSLNLKNNSN